MTVLPIRLFGDPVLTTRASEVTEYNAALRTLVEDMTETMADAGGVGLAANQVGVLRRVFVFDCSHVTGGLRGHVINPVWEPVGEEMEQGTEGCLSIPDISLSIPRYRQVRLQGTDVEGKPLSITASGLLARCIQHETDHLDGVLYLKRAAAEDRKAAMAEIRTSEWFGKGEK
ncbi:MULTISPECIES: peptide deformylase [unclassified Corynebacterium]|uniref:peptide deformylase n=1 Tax=unclassified Corynebacterium TaxID=2624378 RepID=UPI0029C9C9C6|nr:MULTISPECIES: peptide deformylase [unclassified Corynebacterium]WPF65150.1 peptide deformylase [Corynebacterium sp. 22KM0430]WPF67646.1 peptide deformylase [Corynebacterium sp. 21KM1197]